MHTTRPQLRELANHGAGVPLCTGPPEVRLGLEGEVAEAVLHPEVGEVEWSRRAAAEAPDTHRKRALHRECAARALGGGGWGGEALGNRRLDTSV